MKPIFLFLITFLFTVSLVSAQQFTEQTDIELTGVYEGSCDWGDYNNDGLLDFMPTGNQDGYTTYSALFLNEGNNHFSQHQGIIMPIYRGEIEWGDYNNDNFLDIALTGAYMEYPSTTRYTKLYTNNKNESFTEIYTNLLSSIHGGITWGDYNNDGYSDLLHTGLNLYVDEFTAVNN
ncbi:MAG: VCBS repeat-containing protein [Bacteroidales bacterium]|nr:VCBS repeat-containing protein [Bacteroidales bacterium]